MPSVLITGSNRGLGLEWARQYAAAGWRVFATCRNPEGATQLNELAVTHPAVSVHRLDVTAEEQIGTLAGELRELPIDVLLNNAGVYHEKFRSDKLGSLRYPDWEHTFRVNSLGPVRVTERFLEQVARSERRLVVAITSHMGSIGEMRSAGSYYYRSSKAALNASMRGLSMELSRRGIGVLLLHPGWVRTRMGGSEAPLEPPESIRGMRRLIERFTTYDSGRFFRFDGTEIPW